MNLYRQMPSDICNKKITINEEKILELQEPFHPIFVMRTYRKSFENVNRLID